MCGDGEMATYIVVSLCHGTVHVSAFRPSAIMQGNAFTAVPFPTQNHLNTLVLSERAFQRYQECDEGSQVLGDVNMTNFLPSFLPN